MSYRTGSILRQLGLSKEEIIEVLNTDDFPNCQFECQGKQYAKIPGEELRKLGEASARRRAIRSGLCAGSVRDVANLEMGLDRQRTTPMARLRGERVRNREILRKIKLRRA